MNKKNVILIIIVIVLALFGFLLFLYLPGADRERSQSERLPDLTFQSYGGEAVKLRSFEGKPLVANVWAAWCPFCVEELKEFAKAQEEFGEEVVIVAINRAEPLATAKGFTDKEGLTDKLTFFLDPTDSFYRSIGGFSMPETIFVDGQGNIVDRKRGPMDITEINQRIANLLRINE